MRNGSRNPHVEAVLPDTSGVNGSIALFQTVLNGLENTVWNTGSLLRFLRAKVFLDVIPHA